MPLYYNPDDDIQKSVISTPFIPATTGKKGKKQKEKETKTKPKGRLRGTLRRRGTDGTRPTGKKGRLANQDRELQSMVEQNTSPTKPASSRTTLEGRALPASTKEPDKKGRTRQVTSRTGRITTPKGTPKPKAKPKAKPKDKPKDKKSKKPKNWVNPNKRKPQIVGGGEGQGEARAAYLKQHGHSTTRGTLNTVNQSLDTIQGTFQGMLTVLKLNRAPHKTSRKLTTEGEHSGKGVRGGNTQFEGTQVMERNRGGRTVIRDPTGKPKERKAGKLNYQTNIGAASTLKTYSFNSLNTSLDLLKSIFDEQAANRGNPKPRITNTGRSGKGSRGGDTQTQPKALGESKEDQKIMQS